MSEADAGNATQDVMEKMRVLRDAYLETWSKHLIETVNSDSYAEASGAALNSYLNAAAPFKEPAEQAMLRTLQQLHIPSSEDFSSLAGRFTNIEMQLDNLDAKLDGLVKLLARAPATPARRTPGKPAKAKVRAAASGAVSAKKSARKKPAATSAGRSKTRKGTK